MTTTFFMEFLRVLDISIKMQHKNIMFFADSCFALVQVMSFLQNVKFVLFTTVHKHDAFL
jgi:hypothetical protein